MILEIAKPSQILQPYIKHYWYIENALDDGETYKQRIIPCGLPELTLYLGKRPKILGDMADFEDDFLLSGQRNRFYDLQIDQSLTVFSIVFQPQGLMAFFKLPINQLDNKSVSLREIDRNLEYELKMRIIDAPLFNTKIRIIESYLIDLLKEEHNRFDFRRMNQVVNAIKMTQGKIAIDDLANISCLSRKQFERKFVHLIGTTPKQYLKTIRMQLAIYLKSCNKDYNINDLVFDCGYYDQAHFTNDFKKLTGLTPLSYFENNASYSDFFE